ncbi:MAG TPA: ketol-acid reductoisomerase [bacterium]|nr:ketol-acid reductoisomerase [bacterium]
MRVVRQSSLAPLRGRKICIIGFGSQGRAQALNLRDAGFAPLIALPPSSRSRQRARRDRFPVATVAEGTAHSDILFMLAPDHLHGRIFDREIAPHLRAGQTLVFAHASSVHFGEVVAPPTVDVVLVAPLGPGKRLRELRARHDGVACFVAVHRDASGKARARALALARGIGCLPAGAIATTFAEEAVGDLFGEQAVLCGGLSALLQAGVDTLVRHGLKPEHAYLECVYQLDLIVDLVKSEGLRGMLTQISPTAAYGAHEAGPRIITTATRRQMDRLYREITDGRFMARWVARAQRSELPAPRVSRAFQRGEDAVRRAFAVKNRGRR